MLSTDARPVDRPLLTIHETAARLNISRSTIYRLASSGQLPVLRVGGQYRVDPVELDVWLHEQPRVQLNGRGSK